MSINFNQTLSRLAASFATKIFCLALIACLAVSQLPQSVSADDLQILFLGDRGHHQPAKRAAELIPIMKKQGIDVTYTEDIANALTDQNLAKYRGLIVYANIARIDKPNADALLKYVKEGGGFIPLHCASYCFQNNDEVVALIGGQFKRHGTGVFQTVPNPEAANHPIMKDYGGFESWDETYVHHLHNETNRTVLEYRVDAEGREPWTWIRTEGKGRVFYTAWGHDERTWSQPGFQNLVERGIRWAVHDDPARVKPFNQRAAFEAPPMTQLPGDLKPFEFVDVGPEIPIYKPSKAWGDQGKAASLMQQPLPSAESIRRYVTPQDFQLKLFADETQLASKPIAMNWDAAGRLWVCETVDYPHDLAEKNRGNDKIEILEDTNGDGKADKITLFADNLSIPTTILPLVNACIVQNGTETLYLADTDGDGKADVREVLISNWSMGDTHGGISNFRMGIDNWIYAMQGYNQSTPTIDGQPQQAFRMGFWRFRVQWPAANQPGAVPKVTAIEFLRSTNNNTWGLGISEEGLIFGSTANGNPSVFMPVPNRYYERVQGWGPETLGRIADTHLFKPITDKIRQVDSHGGYTAAAGHALYTARTYPQQWWNRTAFVCGPTGKLAGVFVLERVGAGFRSHSPLNLVASNDEWSAPIAAEVGPDGNAWVLDWYNYIIQHNPTPHGFKTGKGNAYLTTLRDKHHGRIYRLEYHGDKTSEDQVAPSTLYRPVDLTKATPEQLVAALKNPTLIVRQHAQRLLVQRGQPDVVPALIKLIEDQSTDSIGLNVAAIHAIWTLDGLVDLSLDGPSLEAIISALKHPSAGVRRNAVAALPQPRSTPVEISTGADGDQAVKSSRRQSDDSTNLSVTTKMLLENDMVHDDDVQVRLAAILALADQPPHPAVGQLIAELVMSPSYSKDRWLNDALTSAAATNAIQFLTSIAEIKKPLDPEALRVVTLVTGHAARSRLNAEQTLELIAAMRSASTELGQTVLRSLGAAWPGDYQLQLTEAHEQKIGALLPGFPVDVKSDVIQLGIKLGSQTLRQQIDGIVMGLRKTLKDSEAKAGSRIEAARQLIQLQPSDEKVVSALATELSAQADAEFAAGLLTALSESNAANVGRELVDRLRSVSPSIRRLALSTMLARPTTTMALLDAMEARALMLGDLSLEQQRSLSNHPDKTIRERAKKILAMGGGLPDADRQKVLDELMPVTLQKGDVDRGKIVYEKHCAKCHKHGSLGIEIGPELTGMGVHPKSELLIHIIDPSRSVEGNFRLYTVLGFDGRVINGMLASETKTSIELIDVESKRHTLLREDIEELRASTKSMMPDGFEKEITPEQMADLLEFLTDHGKFAPVDLKKQATIVSTLGMFNSKNSDLERLIFDDWKPKTFKGVPFMLVDPQGDKIPNAIMLHSSSGTLPRDMPKSVTLPCNMPAKKIHMLSGVSGWGYPASPAGTVSVIVRLHYADGSIENHELKNGEHFADYVRRVDVPKSEFAFDLGGRQIRYLAIDPARQDVITQIDLIKGKDATVPVVMAVTIESL